MGLMVPPGGTTLGPLSPKNSPETGGKQENEAETQKVKREGRSKKKTLEKSRVLKDGGGGWIRTIELIEVRFTV